MVEDKEKLIGQKYLQISYLSDEIDGNEEENRMMLEKIHELYDEIDRLKGIK